MKKHVQLIIIGITISLCSIPLKAQERTQKIDTTEFAVAGVCKMCKARIENAVLIKGVKFAEWNQETGLVQVIYRSDKVSPTELHEAIAEAGHDTEKLKADGNNYDKLPDCCGYRDGVEKH